MNKTQRKKQLNALNTLIHICGTQKQLGNRLGLPQQSVSRWIKTGNIPLNRVIQLERLFNNIVTKEQLSPDFFTGK